MFWVSNTLGINKTNMFVVLMYIWLNQVAKLLSKHYNHNKKETTANVNSSAN